jgi:integrase
MKGSIKTRTLTPKKVKTAESATTATPETTATPVRAEKRYDAIYRDPNGRQRWKTFTKRKDAEKFLASTVVSVHNRSYVELTPVSFTAFVTDWLKNLTGVKPSTRRAYASTITRTLIPAFGDRWLEELDVVTVNGFLGRQTTAGRKPKTVQNQLALLSKILSDAKEAHHLAVNPLSGSRALRRPRPMKAEDRQEVEAFAPDEVIRLLDALDPSYVPLVQTWVSTGLRPGEVIALQWGDLNWAAKAIEVRRTYYGREGVDLVLKTLRSRRSVDIGDQLLAVLGRLARERFGEGPIDPSLPVFLTRGGQRIDVDSFRKHIWTPALVKAGLSYRKPYALRHTFATLLLSQGQSVRYIADQLGHSTAMMTLNVYAKWLPRERREAPGRFEATLEAARTALSSNNHLTESAEPAELGEIHRESEWR